jgi:hypothetical protein
MLFHTESFFPARINLYGTLTLLPHLTCKHLSPLEAHLA